MGKDPNRTKQKKYFKQINKYIKSLPGTGVEKVILEENKQTELRIKIYELGTKNEET